jgi:hypothetical protein
MAKRSVLRQCSQGIGMAAVALAVLVSRANSTYAWGDNESVQQMEFLSKIPYLSRLFKNVGQQSSDSVTAELCVDFDSRCGVCVCPHATSVSELPGAGQFFFTIESSNSKCPGCAGEWIEVESCDDACGENCEVEITRVSNCSKACCAQPELHAELIEHKFEIVRLTSKLESMETQMAMLEEIADVRIENAKLEAKLEMAEELIARMSRDVDDLKTELASRSPRKSKKEAATAQGNEGKKKR